MPLYVIVPVTYQTKQKKDVSGNNSHKASVFYYIKTLSTQTKNTVIQHHKTLLRP